MGDLAWGGLFQDIHKIINTDIPLSGVEGHDDGSFEPPGVLSLFREVGNEGLRVEGLGISINEHDIRPEELFGVDGANNSDLLRIQKNERSGRINSHTLDKVFYQELAEILLDPLVNYPNALVQGDGLFVNPVSRDGVIDVDNRGDLAKAGDLVTPQTTGIAPAIVPLVMLEGHLLGRIRDSLGLVQDFQRIKGVFLDLVELFLGQLSGLIQDMWGDPHLSDVVEECPDAHRALPG